MIAHDDILHAARAHALALSVCTTGATALAATTTGYTRAAGSFLTDGFRAGMELVPDGFPQATEGVITAVSDLALTIAGGRTVAAEASGRTLTVGMPRDFVIANAVHTPTTGVPYVNEEYLYGGLTKPGLGAFGALEATPLYLLRFRLPIGTGPHAASRYADATIQHFAPGTPLTLANGDVARVRGDVAPSAGQATPLGDRFAVLVTIPLRLTTPNSR